MQACPALETLFFLENQDGSVYSYKKGDVANETYRLSW